MLCQYTKPGKYLNQAIYERYLEEVALHELSCSCGYQGTKRFVKHGYYKRTVKTPWGKQVLFILRLKCRCCGKTHAVLHPAIVPYCQILFTDLIQIIELKEKRFSFFSISDRVYETNPSITDDNIRHLLKIYQKAWRAKLATIDRNLLHLLKHQPLLPLVVRMYQRAFFQVRKGYYGFFTKTT